ncbi:MAG: FG-GAP repeat domain-containing protein, partial [Anaerolineales bacterium]
AEYRSGDGAAIHQYPTLDGDVNGDGRLDLIFVFDDGPRGLALRTFVSNGNGTWRIAHEALGDGPRVHQYPGRAGDVDGDGRTDVVFMFRESDQLVLRTRFSNGDGSWRAAEYRSGDGAGIHQYPTLEGDVNGDGRLDLVFVFQDGQGLALRTFFSNGDGAWSIVHQSLGDGSGVHQFPTQAADVDGDRRADLVFVYQNQGLELRTKLSNGDGTWRQAHQVLGDGAGVHGQPTLRGDFNCDGRTDLLFVFHDGYRLQLRVKESLGDGSWKSCSQLSGDGAGILERTVVGQVDGPCANDAIFPYQDGGLQIRTKFAVKAE